LISGTISWSTAGGALQSSTITIDPLVQPQNLDGCPGANSQNANFPQRVVARPESFDAPVACFVCADTSPKSVRCATCCPAVPAPCTDGAYGCSRHRCRLRHRGFGRCR
jgi:hypothetical protein